MIRIIKARGEVDTSLKRVSAEERKLKIIEAEKNDKAIAFLDFIKSKLKLKEEEAQYLEEKILQKYSDVYDAFEAVSRNGLDVISGMTVHSRQKMRYRRRARESPSRKRK